MTIRQATSHSIAIILFVLSFPLVGFSQTNPLSDSVTYYSNMGRYARAIPFCEQWKEKVKNEKGEASAEYATTISKLGDLLLKDGRNEEAESNMLAAFDIRKKALGETHAEVGESCHQLGSFYTEMGDVVKAESYFEKALVIRKAAYGDESIQVASTMNNLGVLQMNEGHYEKAETLMLKSLEIRKKNLGETHKEVGQSYNNLGIVNWKQGKLPKAESCYEKSLEIRKKNLGENHPDVGHSYNNLGLVYIAMGNYPKAETYLVKGMEIKRKTVGDDNIEMAASYNNLANLNKDMGRYAKSLEYNLKALPIEIKSGGENHPDVGGSYNNIGELHWTLGNYRLAEFYNLKALEIWKNAYGPVNVDVAGSYTNLGNIYTDMGKYAKAEPFYLKALQIRQSALGKDHPEMGPTNNHLGLMWKDQKNYAKAEPYFIQSSRNFLTQIQEIFPGLSDAEKQIFFETLTPYSEEFKSYATLRQATNPFITCDLYNQHLATKALLLNSSAKWKHRIKSSGDKKLFLQFTEWEGYQEELAVLLQSTDSAERAGIESLQAKSEKMEKDLSLRSENFAQLADRRLVVWTDVRKRLKPGEAAVEIIRVRAAGIAKSVTDTSDPKKPVYRVKGLTDTIHYAALIVKSESKYPEMVLFKNGNDLEGKYLKLYQMSMKQKLEDDQSYKQFWEKIGAKLGTSSKVYFSPDGVFHSINLNTLQNPKTKKYLIDEKEIRIVTVTKDLVNPPKPENLNKLAYLVGFPNYYKDEDESITYSTERKSPTLTYGLRLAAGEVLAQLPATKVEVTRISDILTAKGWDVQTYTDDKALEENIKESYKPRLMHIATHGYFQPDTETENNPLLRSGLMLTGAGTTLRGGKMEKREDGILTAYEAMNLNLDNTDLVVLSACETGLGEIKNGEGVYGLQRAFKVAGAKTIIMSLWQVNDQTTQELMVSFYRNWLSPDVRLTLRQAQGDKVSKRSAFLKAQKELKAKYSDPYYWGAFVLVGE